MNIEYATIGPKVKITKPTKRDAEFEKMWAVYEPKVRRTASQFAIPGMPGCDVDELVQLGQSVMLHALRTHHSGAFSTYFYHCLHQRFSDSTRAYGRSRYLVVGHNPITDERKNVPCFGSQLDQTQAALRSDGFVIKAVENKTPNTGRPNPSLHVSLDYSPQENGTDYPLGIADMLAVRDVKSDDDMICLIRKSIADSRLRQIAVWLYTGHKANGRTGIMRRLGLKRRQFDRYMHQIRMLLSGELDIEWEGI